MKHFISQLFSQSTKNKYHKVQADWANFYYGNPSKRLKIIGVTGTKGKTTVCNMITSILDTGGKKNAMETTISTKINDRVTPHITKSKWVTTPPSSAVQAFLRKALKAGCEYVILEVTSQAIDQYRVWGIEFDLLIYTNLSHDHLDYHKTKENYFTSKLKIFEQNPQAKFIINADDAYANRFTALPSKKSLFYSVKKLVEHGATARKILTGPNAVTFTVAFDEGQITVDLNLPGLFNVQNALAAFCAGLALGLNPETIKAGLEKITLIPGRMEAVRVSTKQDFTVLVDYAHNPDSLKSVYETVREGLKNKGGRLIAVLGATGNRDKTKRPIMGALAGRYADLVVFTDEDPYNENPATIIEEVAAGIHQGGSKKYQWHMNRNYWKVLDRAQAIRKAVREAQKNDVVLITGKGAEEVMAVGLNQFVPFSDRKIAKVELEKRFGGE